MSFILFYQSQQVWRQVIIFYILFITEFTNVNKPFGIKPLPIGRVILVFIVWIPASEWKKVQYGKAINIRNKMIKCDTNGDSLTKKCIVLFILFHEKNAHTKAKTLNTLG